MYYLLNMANLTKVSLNSSDLLSAIDEATEKAEKGKWEIISLETNKPVFQFEIGRTNVLACAQG